MSDTESKSMKSIRVRLTYEKRGRACFVPHVTLSTVFARAAKRAGIQLSSTEGFSPHARISFGPELPAGVVALNEPADLWLKAEEERPPDFLDSVVAAFNAQMPEGFRVKKCVLPAEGAGALSKECKAAHYLVWTRNACSAPELLSHMGRHYGESVLNGLIEQVTPSRVSAVSANPTQNGIGGWIKVLTADGIVAGWHDMCIVRVSLGRWNGKQMKPIGEDAACLRIEK